MLRRAVSATGLALESRATELELHKSKTPGWLSEGFVEAIAAKPRTNAP
jgi:hypothetical protein